MKNIKLRKESRKKIKSKNEEKITKPFNNYKIFLHICLLKPSQLTEGRNIYKIDSHRSAESSQKIRLYLK